MTKGNHNPPPPNKRAYSFIKESKVLQLREKDRDKRRNGLTLKGGGKNLQKEFRKRGEGDSLCYTPGLLRKREALKGGKNSLPFKPPGRLNIAALQREIDL